LLLGAFKRPGFWVGIGSVVLLILAKELEKAVTALVVGAVTIGVGIGAKGVDLLRKNVPGVTPRSPEKMWFGIELITLAILISSPFVILLLAISYLELVAYLIMAAAWILLFLDLLIGVNLGQIRT